MTWTLEGSGFYHELPDTFDLRSYNRETNVPSQAIQGLDGTVTDRRAIHQRPTSLILSGLVKGESVEDVLAQFDPIAATATGDAPELFLTDTDTDRIIKVQHQSTRVSHEPAKIISAQLQFVTTDDPFWQDKQLTTISNANRFQDLPLGTAPSTGQTFIAGPVTNPALVRGHWALNADIATGKAQATTTGSPYWGEVTAAPVGTIQPARYGFGRKIASGMMTFSGLAQRSDKFSFVFQFRADAAWTTATLFDFNTSNLLLRLNGSNWTIGHGTDIISGPASTYTAGRDYQIAATYDGTTVTLYENGSQIGQGGMTAPTALTTLNIQGGGQIVDAVYFFNNDIGENAIRGFAANQNHVKADNDIFNFTPAIPGSHNLQINHHNYTVELWDASTGSAANAIQNFQNDFFIFGDGALPAANTDTIYNPLAATVTHQYHKRYF